MKSQRVFRNTVEIKENSHHQEVREISRGERERERGGKMSMNCNNKVTIEPNALII